MYIANLRRMFRASYFKDIWSIFFVRRSQRSVPDVQIDQKLQTLHMYCIRFCNARSVALPLTHNIGQVEEPSVMQYHVREASQMVAYLGNLPMIT